MRRQLSVGTPQKHKNPKNAAPGNATNGFYRFEYTAEEDSIIYYEFGGVRMSADEADEDNTAERKNVEYDYSNRNVVVAGCGDEKVNKRA